MEVHFPLEIEQMVFSVILNFNIHTFVCSFICPLIVASLLTDFLCKIIWNLAMTLSHLIKTLEWKFTIVCMEFPAGKILCTRTEKKMTTDSHSKGKWKWEKGNWRHHFHFMSHYSFPLNLCTCKFVWWSNLRPRKPSIDILEVELGNISKSTLEHLRERLHIRAT